MHEIATGKGGTKEDHLLTHLSNFIAENRSNFQDGRVSRKKVVEDIQTIYEETEYSQESEKQEIY